jgi:hypothetical protein
VRNAERSQIDLLARAGDRGVDRGKRSCARLRVVVLARFDQLRARLRERRALPQCFIDQTIQRV